MAPKKAVSAYFLFCNEHRETARARYLAQAETEKVNVAAIAKLLGQEWRSLTDEQRKEYQAKAAEKSADNAAAAAAEREAEPVEGIEGCGGQVRCFCCLSRSKIWLMHFWSSQSESHCGIQIKYTPTSCARI